jgi:hypothetical protein
MNMKTTFLSMLFLLSWTGPAHSAHGIVEEAYELNFDTVTLPANAAGHIRFKPCAHCGNTTLTVDASTTYHNGIRTPAISLPELISAAATQNTRLIYVYYDPVTEVATRVVLSTLSIE